MKRAALNHPKLHALMDEMGVGRPEALGLLTLLWDFTGEYAMDGGVGRYTDEAIARAVDWPTENAAHLVSAFVKSGWLDEHADSSIRLVVHDWWDHCEQFVKRRCERMGIQTVQPDRPARSSSQYDTQHVASQNSKSDRDATLTGPPSLAEPSPANAEPSPAKPKRVIQNDTLEFQEFWNLKWLRKRSKGAARKSWQQALRKTSPDTILDAARVFVVSAEGLSEKTPMPSSWLNQERWEDEPETWERFGDTQPPLTGLAKVLHDQKAREAEND